MRVARRSVGTAAGGAAIRPFRLDWIGATAVGFRFVGRVRHVARQESCGAARIGLQISFDRTQDRRIAELFA